MGREKEGQSIMFTAAEEEPGAGDWGLSVLLTSSVLWCIPPGQTTSPRSRLSITTLKLWLLLFHLFQSLLTVLLFGSPLSRCWSSWLQPLPLDVRTRTLDLDGLEGRRGQKIDDGSVVDFGEQTPKKDSQVVWLMQVKISFTVLWRMPD